MLFILLRTTPVTDVNSKSFAFILFIVLFFIGLSSPRTSQLLINLIILVFAVNTIRSGAKRNHLGILNYGLLIITALILCRFFDTDFSFVRKGSVVYCGRCWILCGELLYDPTTKKGRMKKITIGLFLAMCLFQWFVPAKMIYDSEMVIRDGTPFKFKTLPVDPSDPFRGKYVTLNFEANAVTLADSADWEPGEEVYVVFTTDSAGFATAESLFREKPSNGPYLKTTVSYITTNGPFRVFFELPFDRFYLEESKASRAEQVYWTSQRDSTQITYGLVSIGAGTAILKDLMINDTSIVEIINRINAEDE